MNATELQVLPLLLTATGVETSAVEITGNLDLWRGPFPVDDIAVSAVTAATLAAAQLLAERNGCAVELVRVATAHAAASFQSDALVEPVAWSLPPVWDPIAGDYQTATGWIRLHTNYAHHRAAALRALGLDDDGTIDREIISTAVAGFDGIDLEELVAHEGGAAAFQRSHSDWAFHDAGRAVNNEPLLYREVDDAANVAPRLGPAAMPFADVRVLDLTRVLAGPTATGFLAAWGADVLRIDPPGFEEVPAIVPVTTCGKRTATLDLLPAAGRDQLLDLVRGADVVVHGYRNGALGELGIDVDHWKSVRPGLVVASLDAYGFTGPWATRRGFDSLVQHSTGITRIGQTAHGSAAPVPLPCQALDYGTGWLLAAAVAAGLLERSRTGLGSSWATSLARYAHMVTSLECDVDLERPAPSLAALTPYCDTAHTAWGALRRLAWPGTIGNRAPALGASGPVGASSPRW